LAGDDSPTLNNDVGSIAPRIIKENVISMVCVQSATEIAGLTLPESFHLFYGLKSILTLETNCTG
jgi:hypothetical protein